MEISNLSSEVKCLYLIVWVFYTTRCCTSKLIYQIILSKRLKRPQKAKKPKVAKRALHPLSSILGISESLASTLEKAGYGTVESLAEAAVTKLMAEAKLELPRRSQINKPSKGNKMIIHTKNKLFDRSVNANRRPP